jgi:hypothetical protein
MAWKDTQKGTGRTTRMLERAIYEALHGKQVYVIMANGQDCRDMLDRAIQELPPGKIVETSRMARWRVELNGGGWIEFVNLFHPWISWDQMGVHGMKPDCVYLFDHHVIAMRFRNVLDLLHRWDRPEEEIQETQLPEGPSLQE